MSRYQEVRTNWPILAGATLGMSIGTASLLSPSLGVFFSAIAEDFGWTMADMSALMLPFGVTCCVTSILFGGLIDKVGARPLLILGYVSFLISMVGLYLLPASWPVLLLWIVVLGGGAMANGNMSFARIVNERFDRCRGLALGSMTMGVGTVGIAVPFVTALMVRDWGWRTAYAVLGVLVAVLAPIALAAVWKASGRPSRASHASVPKAKGHGFGYLLRRRAMWTMVIAYALISVGLNGYLIHIVPMLKGMGFTLVEAAAAQSLFSAAMILSRVSTGAAIDRFFAPYVSAATCFAAAGGMLLVVWAGGDRPVLTFVGVCMIGVSYGAEADVLAYTMSRYFGIESFGKSFGTLHGLGILAAGMSPILIAHFSAGGADYSHALLLTSGLLALGAVVFLTAPPFQAGNQASRATVEPLASPVATGSE